MPFEAVTAKPIQLTDRLGMLRDTCVNIQKAANVIGVTICGNGVREENVLDEKNPNLTCVIDDVNRTFEMCQQTLRTLERILEVL